MSNDFSKGACCGRDSKPRNRNTGSETEQGKWIVLDGMKTYVTGPPSSKRGILFMYDVLGLIPQSTYGCDLLVSSADGPFFVIMPDWFEGHAAKPEWLPPKTDAHQAKMQDFFKTTADVPKSLTRTQRLFPTFQSLCPSVEKWAIVGFCWGGKIAALASQKGTPFTVSVQSSPAFLDHRDAEKIVIPTGLMASKGELKHEVDKYKAALKVDHYVELFTDLEHGWMTSRANLEQEDSRAAHAEGYRRMAAFLAQYM